MPLNWPFGEFTCLYRYPVVEIFYGASVWCIVVIAIERYHQLFPLKLHIRNKHAVRRAKIIAALVWVFSFIILCFPLFFAVDYSGPFKWRSVLRSDKMDTFLTDSICNLS